MSNMSYCRFYNTQIDLEDCQSTMEGQDEYYQCRDDLDDEEYAAFKRLVDNCRAIVDMVDNQNHVFVVEEDDDDS
jgi:hypothetical protein